MIELAYDLSFGGLSIALIAISLRHLVALSYHVKEKKYKLETYITLGKIKHLGLAISAAGGALGLLYILAEIKGG